MTSDDRDALDGLSARQRATLLRRLWAELADAPERQAAHLAALDAEDCSLRGALDSAGATKRARTAVAARGRLGRGLGFWRSTPALLMIFLLGLGFLADFGIGLYQERQQEARQRQEILLQNTAFGRLYSELLRVEQEPDGRTYRLTTTMQNIDPSSPIYVMLLPVRAYVQVGLGWQEVPSRPAERARQGVVELVGGYDDVVLFEVSQEDWTELIPGYMHIRIDQDMLISNRAQPEDDIIERDNRYYVYLKPHGADDAEIKRRSDMSGTPPVYMPMPPH